MFGFNKNIVERGTTELENCIYYLSYEVAQEVSTEAKRNIYEMISKS